MTITKNLSNAEKKHVRDTLNHRKSGRTSLEARQNFVLAHNHISSADGSVKIAHGDTIIEISVKFKENEHIVQKALKIKNNLENTRATVIFVGDIHSLNIFGLEDYLSRNRLFSLVIETKVLFDDGNVIESLYFGLNKIFKCLFSETIYTEAVHKPFRFPKCSLYAVFGEKYLLDPDLAEEKSCDALVEVYTEQDAVLGLLVRNCNSLDPYILAELITSSS